MQNPQCPPGKKFKPFRLFDLPAGPMKRIMMQFDFFDLALRSDHVQEKIKLLPIKPNNFTIIHLNGKHGFHLSIGTGLSIYWYFEDVPEAKDPKEFRIRYTVDGVHFPTRTKYEYDCVHPGNPNSANVSLYDSSKLKPGYRQYRETFNVAFDRPKGKQYHTVTYTPTTMSASPLPKCWTPNICSDYHSAISHFVNFVKDVFKSDITGYHMDIRSVPNFGKFFTKNVINGPFCKQFELRGMTQKENNPLKLDAYDIDWMLTNTPSKTKLILSCDEIVGNFKWEEPLTQKAIKFNCKTLWFTAANLHESKCNSIEMGRTQLDTFDFRDYIRNWFNGSNKEFQYLDVGIITSQGDNMRKVLFDAFQTMEFDKQRELNDFEQNPFHSMSESDLEKAIPYARDIERNDGMVATIAILHSNFLFVVWHEKEENKKEK